ncbi:aromatic ring-hydroxylating dioxygenase subunit alpha [Sphingorhabdus sp. YGSMI21]|uniref:aromatic ring-hydroxylating dioxygenase subunit alpha n=1 Tax=Sphingorhabdus sp. YGSMI21 TaxID=2077182 RepID=UPI0013DB18D0|nr:aromatic ring-hydroxylating dioxygenase subunit alpha [Sphingorhabdus sp. YGSMI21]
MAFLKNVWYCAGFSHELDDAKLLGRKLVGEHVLIYRTESGEAVAMSNVCPHRFAPLSEGHRYGDNVSCPYHGLEFNAEGQCVRNPNGDKGTLTDLKAPRVARLKSYPLEELWGILFIWMGKPEKADTSLIPDFSMTEERPGHRTVFGFHKLDAHYELAVDNLMDRTHVQFLHPRLNLGTDFRDDFERRYSTEQIGDEIWDYHCELNAPRMPLTAILWPEAPELMEYYFDVRWNAPGHMLLDAGSVAANTDRKIGSHTPGANMVTPIDEHSCYYFWNNCRDSNLDSAEADKGLQHGITDTFANEDGRMVAMCQEMMDGETDLLSMKPLLLPSDEAAVRARRVIARKLREEAEEEAREAADNGALEAAE